MRIPHRIFLVALFCSALAGAQDRPGLFFREDWKETPPEVPATQAHVANADLLLTLHGPSKLHVKKSHHDQPADDPYYIWSGLCLGNWAVSLKHKGAYADLTGQAKIRWRTKQAGFRALHVVLKLADGTWLVSVESDPASLDWREREFNAQDLHWRKLEIGKIIEQEVVERPNLGRVDEVGFTDLMNGGESIACSRLDWMEVYGKPVKR